MTRFATESLPDRFVGFVADRDHRIMKRVHRWYAPRRLRIIMLAATRCGDGWLWYGIGFLIDLFGAPERFCAIETAGFSAGAGLVVYLGLKNTTRRSRPCSVEPHCWAHLVPPDRYSFPSGHTITAFTVATALTRFYPAFAVPLSCCALCIAASRIVLGMHFLSDVLVGAAIGSGLACGVFAAMPV